MNNQKESKILTNGFQMALYYPKVEKPEKPNFFSLILFTYLTKLLFFSYFTSFFFSVTKFHVQQYTNGNDRGNCIQTQTIQFQEKY